MHNKEKHTHAKEILKHELSVYLMYSFFLALLFFTFTVYERVLLGTSNNSILPYGFCIIKALILAKVVMIGEALHIGERYSHKPLIVPVIYKTINFCLLVLILEILEHLIIGFIHKDSFKEIYTEYTSHNFNLAAARVCVMFFVFILFFSVLETSRALGKNKLFNMFFKEGATSQA